MLQVGDEKLALPASSNTLLQTAQPSFAGLIVPRDAQVSSAARAQPAGIAWLPAAASPSRSALVRADVPLSTETVEWNGSSITIVMHQPSTGAARPVAAAITDRSRWRSTRVSLLALSSLASERQGALLDVARQEHLYTMGFRQDANARFCIGANKACDGDQLLSQAEALQRIARRRECVSATLPDGARAASPSWRTVQLEPSEGASSAKPAVSVRVSDAAGPVAGAQILFTKLPHSACSATSQADGTATCVLADNHGHAGGHPEFDREPVVVTFPGDLRRNPILLPTTQLLRVDAQPRAAYLPR